MAKKLATHFNFPIVSADQIKEMMFDRIGNWQDKKLFDLVGKASYDLMYHALSLILSTGQSCILEAFLKAEMAEPKIAELKKKYACEILQFQVNCDPLKIIERYENRHDSDERHPCHPRDIPKEDFIKLKGRNNLVKVDGETIILNTTDFEKVDWALIFQKVKEKMQWSREEFLKELPKKRVAVGIILHDERGKVLILKPTYEEHWTIPGGVIEEGEFIADGLEREMREEIGVFVKSGKLSVIDSMIVPEGNSIDDSLQFIFEGTISAKEVVQIKLAKDEISEFKFVEKEEALKLLSPNLAKRVSYVFENKEGVIFLKNGESAD
jgi:ADP-ribose pyrophosphatase YjhB (NUDIX family)